MLHYRSYSIQRRYFIFTANPLESVSCKTPGITPHNTLCIFCMLHEGHDKPPVFLKKRLKTDVKVVSQKALDVQGEFAALAGELGRAYPDRARLWFAYDEPLSHLIYAGADILLVPSIFEPCGLTQMIAMRYMPSFIYACAAMSV